MYIRYQVVLLLSLRNDDLLYQMRDSQHTRATYALLVGIGVGTPQMQEYRKWLMLEPHAWQVATMWRWLSR